MTEEVQLRRYLVKTIAISFNIVVVGVGIVFMRSYAGAIILAWLYMFFCNIIVWSALKLVPLPLPIVVEPAAVKPKRKYVRKKPPVKKAKLKQHDLEL